MLGNIVCISCDGEVIPTNIPFVDEKTYSFGNIKSATNAQLLSNMRGYETKDRGYNRARTKMRKLMTAPKHIIKKVYPLLLYKNKIFMERLQASIQKEQKKEEKNIER